MQKCAPAFTSRAFQRPYTSLPSLFPPPVSFSWACLFRWLLLPDRPLIGNPLSELGGLATVSKDVEIFVESKVSLFRPHRYVRGTGR